MTEHEQQSISKKEVALIEHQQEKISITEAIKQMIDEVSDDRWRQVAQQRPDDYEMYFRIKYKTIADTHQFLFYYIMRHKMDDPEIRRVVLHMLQSRDEVTLYKTKTKEQVADEIVDPIYEKHLYPVLNAAEQKRLEKQNK